MEKREEEHLEKDAACNETHWNERMGDDDSEEDENDEDEEEDGGEDDSEDFSSDEFSDEDDEEERRVLREKFGVQAEEDHDERHEDVRHGAQRHGTHEPSLSEETADEDANEGRPQVPNGGPVASMKGMVKEGMKWMQNLDLGVSDATIEWHAQAIDQQRLPGTPNMPLPVDEVAFRERLVASMKLGSRDQVCTYHVEHGLMVDRVDGETISLIMCRWTCCLCLRVCLIV